MTKHVIERVEPGELVQELQQVLTDLISLSLQAKHAHWNVIGARFTPLHQTFDAFADAYRNWYDDIAERLRALNAPADGRASTLAKTAKVRELPAGEMADGELTLLFLELVEGMAGRVRGVMESVRAQDAVTEHMLIEIVLGLEKQAWMLRVQGRNRD